MQSLSIGESSENQLSVQKESYRTPRYDFVRAVATVLVIIWHFNTTCQDYFIELVHPLFNNPQGTINAGAVGVVLFFTLSGTLVTKNCEDGFSLAAFYKRRMARIFIPHFLSYAIMYAVCYILTPDYFSNTEFLGVLLSFFGLNYFSELSWTHWGIAQVWLVGEWFTTVIVLLYLVFPVIRFLFRHSIKIGTILITLIFLLNLKLQFLTYGAGWFSITNALFCFWLGMLFKKWEKILITKKALTISIAVCILMLITNPSELLGIPQLPSHIFGIALFVCLTYFNYSNALIAYISKYNYEAYLIHHRIFILAIPCLVSSTDPFLKQVLILIILLFGVFMFAEKLQHLINKL